MLYYYIVLYCLVLYCSMLCVELRYSIFTRTLLPLSTLDRWLVCGSSTRSRRPLWTPVCRGTWTAPECPHVAFGFGARPSKARHSVSKGLDLMPFHTQAPGFHRQPSFSQLRRPLFLPVCFFEVVFFLPSWPSSPRRRSAGVPNSSLVRSSRKSLCGKITTLRHKNRGSTIKM